MDRAAERETRGTRPVIVRLRPGSTLSPDPAMRGGTSEWRGFVESAVEEYNARPLFPDLADGGIAPRGDGSRRSNVRSAAGRLGRYVRLDAPSREAARALIDRLRTYGSVETAYVEPELLLPRSGIPLGGGRPPSRRGSTRSFEDRQRYLEDDSSGMGIRFAWTVAGTNPGEGVQTADIEKGWFFDHEDFDLTRVAQPATRTGTQEEQHHGTATIGLLIARPDSSGIRGIAPGVDQLHCIAADDREQIAPNAIRTATKTLNEGDVMLIELDAESDVVGRRIPVEFWSATYDVIREANRKGIIVVAAAGNGGIDLGDPRLGGAFTRRDSGAILVGGGGAPGSNIPDRARIPAYNCGRRVNVQAYGAVVCTTGMGGLQGGPEEERWYTADYGGTSSAAALVWASCVLLQSIAKKHGRALSPAEMRDLLVRTGRPQECGGQPCTEPIGPRPDLRAALEELGILT